MHVEPTASPPPADDGVPWYKLLTRYHWFVLVVAALGWLFDTMDQQLTFSIFGDDDASPLPAFLTIAEAAQRVRCCERTIRRAVWADSNTMNESQE